MQQFCLFWFILLIYRNYYNRLSTAEIRCACHCIDFHVLRHYCSLIVNVCCNVTHTHHLLPITAPTRFRAISHTLLGIMKRNFSQLTIQTFVLLYIVYFAINTARQNKTNRHTDIQDRFIQDHGEIPFRLLLFRLGTI